MNFLTQDQSTLIQFYVVLVKRKNEFRKCKQNQGINYMLCSKWSVTFEKCKYWEYLIYTNMLLKSINDIQIPNAKLFKLEE